MSSSIPTINIDEAPDYHDLIRRDRIHGSLYTSSAVYRDELERIFYGGWVYVGHESEIPEKAILSVVRSAKSRFFWCVTKRESRWC